MNHIGPVHARRDAAYRVPRKSFTQTIMEYLITLLAVIGVFVFYFYLLFEVSMSRVTWDCDRTIIMVAVFAAFSVFILRYHQPTVDELSDMLEDMSARGADFASGLSDVVIVMFYVVMMMYASTICILFYVVPSLPL